ncbi:MAG: phosphatase PAP2 family protein [Pseudomonadota bacterium]
MFARRIDAQSDWPAVQACGRALHRAEAILLGMLAALLVASVAVAALRQQAVQWSDFAPAIGISLVLIAVGIYARIVKNAERLALGVIGFGVFMAFTGTVSILAFTIFPFANPMIDRELIAWDATLGFSWLGFVEFMSGYPMFSRALGYVYMSSLAQIVAVIMLLAFLRKGTELHRFLMVGFVMMFVTLIIWTLYPSIGPTAYIAVPPRIQAEIGLVTTNQVGATLLRWANEGNALITADIVTGVVAFPSFHIGMACMVAWFCRATPAFVPALAINLLMVPATILQGGHHLVDIFAAVLTFGLCLWIACRIVPRPV